MSHVIVIEFVSLDGAVQDPDGAERTEWGGWAFRYGPEAVAGDKFQLGEALDRGALLLGRRTWERFAGIWPSRTDAFSTRMNRVPKLVLSRSLEDVGAWGNSCVVRGDLAHEVSNRSGDLVVAGSTSVVDALRERDLVDEYRLLVFPCVLGRGRRLFPDGIESVSLELTSAQRVGPAALLVYERSRPEEVSCSTCS